MIKDSGERTEFDTGAVRDMSANKGRCDLMPITCVGRLIASWGYINESPRVFHIFNDIDAVMQWLQRKDARANMYTEIIPRIHSIIEGIYFVSEYFDICKFEVLEDTANTSPRTMVGHALLDVSIHFKEGAEKYGEYNWQKGIPISSYMNSAIRHAIKHTSGFRDERHDRACIWNLLCMLWTLTYKPELNDMIRSEKDV